jgi:hypothetical protein
MNAVASLNMAVSSPISGLSELNEIAGATERLSLHEMSAAAKIAMNIYLFIPFIPYEMQIYEIIFDELRITFPNCWYVRSGDIPKCRETSIRKRPFRPVD